MVALDVPTAAAVLEPAPSATSLALLAVAALPIATELVPVDVATGPIATLLVPDAVPSVSDELAWKYETATPLSVVVPDTVRLPTIRFGMYIESRVGAPLVSAPLLKILM